MKAFLLRSLQQGLAVGLLAVGPGLAQAACGPQTTLTPSDDYSLTFQVCDDSLLGTVTAKGTGWVAVGFSQDQYMPQTDVFMAGVLPDGTTYFKDAFAYFRSPPATDTQQDVTLLDASEVEGVTSYRFTRRLKTGDSGMDYDLTQGSYHLLMAFNEVSDSMTDRHTFADPSDLTYQFAPVPVPEPQTLALLLAGLGVVAVRSRTRRAR